MIRLVPVLLLLNKHLLIKLDWCTENGLGKVGVAGNGQISQKKQAATEAFPKRVTQAGPGQVEVDRKGQTTPRGKEKGDGIMLKPLV